MTYYKRTDWGARHVEPGVKLEPRRVEGIALHWPGDSLRRRTVAEVQAALRSWQANHIDVQKWRDIGYQAAVDQAGNVYRLRGLGYQSAANGDEDVNQRFGAVLLVVAIGEEPSDAMVAAVRRLVERHRRMFPRSKRVVPHSMIRPEPTDCPGNRVRSLIDEGVFG